jgi:hypothetical protein
MASENTLLGAAGEHYVMCELLRRGYIAALAPHGVPNADIVVTDIEGTRLCSIQVKTRRHGSNGGWIMSAKHERIRGERLFYCFVDFQQVADERPLVFVVPTTVVADVLSASHRKWLATPGRLGQVHKDGPIRQFLPSYSHIFLEEQHSFGEGWLNRYRDNWDILSLEPANVDIEADSAS